jgi:serpin B
MVMLKPMLIGLLTTMMLAGPAMADTPLLSDAARANNDFGWSIFEKLQDPTQLKKTENILFSPLSAWLALSLASNGAEQETLEEMQAVLRTDQSSLAETNPQVRDLISSLLANPGSTEMLRLANAVWVNSDRFELAEKFQSDAETFYAILPDREVVSCESFQEASTLQHINAWVSQNTGGMIPNIVKQLDPDMASILLNALYFQAQWLQPFSATLTGNDSFQRADGSTQTVRMMHAYGLNLPFASNGQYKMISLAFRSASAANGEGEMGRFVLDLVLPHAPEGDIFALQKTDYETLLASMQAQIAHVSVPQFTFSFEKSLTDVLQASGMQRAFQADKAQMGRLGNPKQAGRVYISEVLQKTAVEMDENGFKAAAVTAVIVGSTSAPVETVSFVADRPFFVALRDRVTGTLLFLAVIANPKAA